VARVLDAYLETLETMKRLDLEIAGEFLVMAATLAWLKSRMLLPQEERPDEEAEEEDPRLDLARRLFELRQFQEVGRQLKDRDWLGRDVYVRRHPAREVQVGEAGLLEVDLFALIAALDRVLRRAELRRPLSIEKHQVPLRRRLPWLLELVGGRRQVTFDEAFADVRSREGVVVTFLAVLELARLHLVRIFQAGPGSVIHLEAAFDDLGAARGIVARAVERGELADGAGPDETEAGAGVEA